MTKITTEPRYLEHDGGTKFYEVIEFWNPDAKKFLLVKRWGKIGTLGETMVEAFGTMRACNSAAEKILKSKMGRGYEKTSSVEGFHGRGRSLTGAELIALLGTHYRSKPFTTNFVHDVGINDLIQGLELDTAVFDEMNDVVVEEPAPEPDRGESWASW